MRPTGPLVGGDVLEAPRYCSADAARLVGLSSGQVRRYLRGYTYKQRAENGGAHTRHRAPVTRRAGSAEEPYASFLDLIDLLVVKRFLARKFSLQRVRGFIEDVWAWSDCAHIASRRFFTLDGSAFVELVSASGSALRELGKSGQLSLLKEIHVDRLNMQFEAQSGLALRWFPVGQSGSVMLDPQVSFGRPVLRTVNIPTGAVHDLFVGEGRDAAAVARWYRISERDVKAAVEYEVRLAA